MFGSGEELTCDHNKADKEVGQIAGFGLCPPQADIIELGMQNQWFCVVDEWYGNVRENQGFNIVGQNSDSDHALTVGFYCCCCFCWCTERSECKQTLCWAD